MARQIRAKKPIRHSPKGVRAGGPPRRKCTSGGGRIAKGH